MFSATATLRSIALAYPATIRIFENYQLDYCCGGNRPLAEACGQKNLSTETVLAALQQAAADESAVKDLSKSSLTGIIAEIVHTHHNYIRAELPRLQAMAEKVGTKHGPTHHEVLTLGRMLADLAEDLLQHLAKEEVILFPYIEKLERSQTDGSALPHACFASVSSPIQAMINEHEGAGALMEKMREITGNYTAPADACPTFIGLYAGLDAFERDLHIHVHRENNLLFPRAVALEQAALAAA